MGDKYQVDVHEIKNNRQFKLNLHAFILKHAGSQAEICSCRIHKIANLIGAEKKVVDKAVDKRRYEFSAGRYCARKCLSEFGLNNIVLPKGDFGEPIWPTEFTGSISHHSNLAIAVVRPEGQGRIGIDIVCSLDEFSSPEIVLSNSDIDQYNKLDVPNPGLVLFSMKESVIKILSPLLQAYIEYKDISIRLDKTSAVAIYWPENKTFEIHWMRYDQFVITVALLPNG